ncbi:AmmeMemoRadiSam system protein A [Acidobacteriia bacterium AH_259_A11_L15]|nr:AmmeMemoRadiSam system protein A [Acidobacteriia bacterium AH_259_A11_L15]
MSSFTSQEQRFLLDLARQAIATALMGSAPHPDALAGVLPSDALRLPGAAFVTVRKQGLLRGCVGVVQPKPLYQAIASAALSAALRDPRFPPVTPEELPGLEIEISLLSPFFPIMPEELQVGEHGLLVSDGFHRGLLLPQVAREMGWDRERFLEEACLKAGLARTAWKEGAKLEAFTAVVFSETTVSAEAPAGKPQL